MKKKKAKKKKKLAENHGHNNLALFDVWLNFLFISSQIKRDCH